MTYKQLKAMISELAEALSCECAYSHFKDKKTRNRFLCWLVPRNDDFHADGINYLKKVELNIEFYSSIRDFEAETTIEDFLKDRDIAFGKESVYIQSEELYETIYSTEVIINE